MKRKWNLKKQKNKQIFVYLRDLGRLKNETAHPVHDEYVRAV